MKLFLSYPSEKLAEAREVYNYLHGLGIDVWFDKESIVGGLDWSREIIQAQQSADLIVLLCSTETVRKSGIYQREINTIVRILEEKPLGSIFLISIRLENVSLPPEISRFQWIDFFDSDWKMKLRLSLERKLKQLGEPLPEKFQKFPSNRPYTSRELRFINDKLSIANDLIIYDIDQELSDDQRDYWSYINSEIVSKSFGSFYKAKSDLYECISAYNWDRKLESSLSMEEFYRCDNLLSLRFSWYMDSGGAHPSHGIFTMNFNGPDHGKVTLHELLGYNDKYIDMIQKYCSMEISKELIAEGDDIEAGEFFDFLNDEHRWEAFSEYGVNTHGITINLSPYSVLPFVFGTHVVSIPWKHLTGKIASRYRDSPIGLLGGASIIADAD